MSSKYIPHHCGWRTKLRAHRCDSTSCILLGRRNDTVIINKKKSQACGENNAHAVQGHPITYRVTVNDVQSFVPTGVVWHLAHFSNTEKWLLFQSHCVLGIRKVVSRVVSNNSTSYAGASQGISSPLRRPKICSLLGRQIDTFWSRKNTVFSSSKLSKVVRCQTQTCTLFVFIDASLYLSARQKILLTPKMKVYDSQISGPQK